MNLDDVEAAVLWNAIEGSFLIEFRNGTDPLPRSPVESYRANIGAALLSLLSRGLIQVGLAKWPGSPEEPAALLNEEQLSVALADGSAWDSDREDLIVLTATEAGRDVLLPPPGPRTLIHRLSVWVARLRR